MYRTVILEFLHNNQKVLFDSKFLQMTMVLFPDNLNSITKLFEEPELITVYHIKDQYTFLKQYTFDKIDNSVIEIALEYQERLTVNIEDLNFDVNDPYYLKDIKNINFSSFEIIPIKKDDEIVAICLLYSDMKNASFKLSNQKLLTFYEKLSIDCENTYIEQISKLINISENYYYIIKSLKNELYYLSDNFRDDYKFKLNVVSSNDVEFNKIKKNILFMKYTSNELCEVYYLPKSKLKEHHDNLEIYLQDSINNHGFSGDVSLIFTKDLNDRLSSTNLGEKFLDAFRKVVPDVNIKCYQIENGALAFILNSPFSKKLENELRHILKKEHIIVVNIPKDFSKNSDLIKLTTYLNEMLPTTFSLNDYKKYLDDENYQKYLCAKATLPSKKIMIKADTLDTIGEIITGPLENYYKISTYKIFENTIIENFDVALNKDYQHPIFTILVTSISRRKIFEQLKKIIIKYPTTKLIIHAPLIIKLSPEEVFGAITKVKELGFVVIIDSTIFMNIEFSASLKIADAVLIRKNECKHSITMSNPFNKCLFDEYYEHSKVVIFEAIPSETDASLINELTCLVIDKD